MKGSKIKIKTVCEQVHTLWGQDQHASLFTDIVNSALATVETAADKFVLLLFTKFMRSHNNKQLTIVSYICTELCLLMLLASLLKRQPGGGNRFEKFSKSRVKLIDIP